MRKNVLKVATIATGIVSVSFLSSCHNRDNMMSDDAKSKMERTLLKTSLTRKNSAKAVLLKELNLGNL